MSLPKARKEELVIQVIDNELVIYDQRKDKAHALNPTAKFVFEHCDGKTSLTELKTMLENEYDISDQQADNILWMSLDRLEKTHLLESNVIEPSGYKVLTRRKALQMIGITAVLLPVVTSIVASPAAAWNSDNCGLKTCPGGTQSPCPDDYCPEGTTPVETTCEYWSGETHGGVPFYITLSCCACE